MVVEALGGLVGVAGSCSGSGWVGRAVRCSGKKTKREEDFGEQQDRFVRVNWQHFS